MAISEVLGEAWSLYKRFIRQFFLTALVVFAVLDLISALANQASTDSAAAAAFWGIVSIVISIVGYFWVQGALVEAVHDVMDGRADSTVGELYRKVQPRLPALIVAGLLAGIAIGIGLLLFVVPGLYLLTIWSLIVVVIVLEGRSASESFSRSREIVRGHGWSVFGLVIITAILVGIASGLIQLVFSPLPDFLDTWLGSLIAHSLTVPFMAAALTVAYYRLTAARAEPVPPQPAV
jgi:hypothetical protein